MATAYERDALEDRVVTRVYDHALMVRLTRYLRPYIGLSLLAFLLVLLSSAISLAPPLIIGRMVDDVFVARHGSHLPWFAAGFLALFALSFAVDYASGYLLQLLGQRIVHDLRVHVFEHLCSLSLRYFQRQPVGRLVTRVTNDVEALRELFSAGLITLFKDFFMLVGIAVALVWVAPGLAVLTLAVMPLMVGVALVFRRYSRRAYRDIRAAVARINAFLAESIQGIRVVQLFAREQVHGQRMDELNRQHLHAFQRMITAWACFRPGAMTLAAAATGVVLWHGGRLTALGSISIGTLVAFVYYVEELFQPIRDLIEKLNILQGGMSAAERLFTVLDTEADVRDRPGARLATRLRGEVEFRDVRFAYLPGEEVLHGVSFTIRPGETVAVVGPTGAGKSTLMHLLARHFDVDGGQVLVDGCDVRDYQQRSLRRNLAIVPQDVFLFSGSVADNIRLFAPDVADETVRRAAEAVAADGFIGRLPAGYAHLLHEGGKGLSAGERQLLSFARALAVDPVILMLDEATANIDTHLERVIQRSLRRLCEGRTAILIAHRLSTIRNADRILVLHQGDLVETGTHEELLARRGVYFRLHEMQYRQEQQQEPQEADDERRPPSERPPP